MGYIGLLFKREFFEEEGEVFFEDASLKENIVVFVEREAIDYNIILGCDPFFKEEECSFFYFDKFFDIRPFLVFDKSIFRYGKISLGERTIIDYECFTFWFNTRSYIKLRELFLIGIVGDDLEAQLKRRSLKILEYI